MSVLIVVCISSKTPLAFCHRFTATSLHHENTLILFMANYPKKSSLRSQNASQC